MTATDDTSQNLWQIPQLKELISRGSRDGQLSYNLINQILGDLQFDESAVEALLEALENRGIKIVDENEIDAPGTSAQKSAAQDNSASSEKSVSPAKKTRRPTKSATTSQQDETSSETLRHADLDEVLASLEMMLASTEESLAASTDSGNATKGSKASRDHTARDNSDIEDAGEEAMSPPVEDAYRQYLNQLGRVPLLTAEEEIQLAVQAKHGTPEEQKTAREKLVESNLRLVVYMARKYAGRSTLPLLDIVQEGNIGLMRAVDRFDPARGHRLSTYATWWIRQSINRAIGEQTRSIRLPAHLSNAIQKLQRLQRELPQTLGRVPSRQELAEASGMTVVQVEEALRAAVQPISLESPVGEEEDMELGESLADTQSESPLSIFSRQELRSELERAFESLSERERIILQKRYGMGEYESDGAKTLEDIAQELRLSRERVRQLEIRALRKLRRRSHDTPLGEVFEDDDEE